MAGSFTVRTHGVKELARDFGRVAPILKEEIRDELKEAGELVKRTSQGKLRGFHHPVPDRTISGLRVRAIPAQSRVYVEQGRGRTTGKRKDWGSTQMRRALLPALEQDAPAVVERIDKLVSRVSRTYDL
jgi:hypothetical protein